MSQILMWAVDARKYGIQVLGEAACSKHGAKVPGEVVCKILKQWVLPAVRAIDASKYGVQVLG